MKLSDNRKLFSSGIFDQRLGAITIFSSFLERYCAHQEKSTIRYNKVFTTIH